MNSLTIPKPPAAAPTVLAAALAARAVVTPAVPAPVRVVAASHPFLVERVDVEMPAGMTLEAMVEAVQPDPVLLAHAHVFIGDHIIPRHNWARARPNPGTTVTVRVVPMGGGGGKKNPLRIILSIAVIAASFALPGLILTEAAFASEIIGSLTLGQALGGAIGLVGSLLVNAIAPPPRPKTAQLSGSGSIARSSATLSIEGARNSIRPYQPIPRPLGTHRAVPPLGAQQFTEIVGKDQYLRGIVVWGYGPLDISNLKLGETLISEFGDFEIETRQGFDSDLPLTLYTQDVFEDAFQISLKQKDGWRLRTSQPDIDELSIDITFPQGLIAIADDEAFVNAFGNSVPRTVTLEIESSPTGAGTWTPIAESPVSITDHTNALVRVGYKWNVARGQYDVRVRRTAPADAEDSPATEDFTFDETFWTALRSIADEDPIKATGLAVTAFRAKATGKLNGFVDELNATVTSILPDWDTGTSTWITRATDNPASLFREVLQGAANKRPLPDARVDLLGLQDWHDFCVANGFSFNAVIDFQSTVRETLKDIAAAGRAGLSRPDNKEGVVIDRLQAVPAQHFTTRNSFGFQGKKTFEDLPHGWRVRFQNEQKDYRQDEMIVYDDGIDESNATKFELLDLFGITDPDQIWKAARYHIATARLRPETFSHGADIEHIVATQGDLVHFSHDVPLFGLLAARVKSVADDAGGPPNAISVTLDDAVTMEAGKSYSVRFRLSDGATLVKAVDTVAGEQFTLTFSTPFDLTLAPDPGDLAMVGETGLETVELIVKSIVPAADDTARITYVAAAPAVHTADQGTIPAFDSQITLPATALKPPPPAIEDIRSDETVLLFDNDGSLRTRMLVDFTIAGSFQAIVSEVQSQFRLAGASQWITGPGVDDRVGALSITDVHDLSTYEVRLRAVSREAVVSDWSAPTTHKVIGQSTVPPDPTGATVQAGSLFWSLASPPRDLAGFLVRSQAGNNKVWASAAPAHDGVIGAPPFPVGQVGAGLRTIMVKAVDDGGRESANPASVVLNFGDPPTDNVVLTRDYRAEGFPGTITGGALDAGDLVSNLTAGSDFWIGADSNLFWTGLDATLVWSPQYETLIYEAAFVPLERAQLTLVVVVVAASWTLDYRHDGPDLAWTGDDTAAAWSGADATAAWVGAKGPWLSWPGALDAATPIDFRLTAPGATSEARVTAFAASLDVADIVEELLNVAIAAEGTRLPVTKTYRQITNATLTLLEDGGQAASVHKVDDGPGGPLVRARHRVSAYRRRHQRHRKRLLR